VAIAIPLQIYMILCFDRRSLILKVSGIILGALVILGSIVGIVLLTFDFCQQWSGYWSFTFLWGILLEAFGVQTVYMLTRYLFLSYLLGKESKEV